MTLILEILGISALVTGANGLLYHLTVTKNTIRQCAEAIKTNFDTTLNALNDFEKTLERLRDRVEAATAKAEAASDLPLSTAGRVSDIEGKLPRIEAKAFDADKKADEHITQLTWHRNQEHGELTKAILDVQKDLAQVKETMRHFKDW